MPEGPKPLRRGEERQRRRTRRRRMFLGALAAAALGIVGLVAFYEIEAHPFGSEGKAVVIKVEPRESVGAVVDTLASRGVIGSSFAFRLFDLVHGTPTVQPGRYLFHQNQSFSAVHGVLGGGPDVFTLEVTPGLTVAEVENRVSQLPFPPTGSFLKVLTRAAASSSWTPAGSGTLEGAIGAGPYRILPGESAKHLVDQMVTRFQRHATSLDLSKAASTLGVTPDQLVIVASIVEKEGVYKKNMAKVARVIYNRLAKGSPLQMDSTVLYAMGRDGGPVTQADLATPSPYNTYLHTGLPPTAICTPSWDALMAAAHPAPGNWLYFQLVSKDGTEQFSDTYAGQLAAEALARSRGLP